MEKTNIRINNHYIIKNSKGYYLTDIDQLNSLEEVDDFSDYLENKPITQKVEGLIEEFEEEDFVNFILSDAEFSNIKNNLKIDPIKMVNIHQNKQSGDNYFKGISGGG